MKGLRAESRDEETSLAAAVPHNKGDGELARGPERAGAARRNPARPDSSRLRGSVTCVHPPGPWEWRKQLPSGSRAGERRLKCLLFLPLQGCVECNKKKSMNKRLWRPGFKFWSGYIMRSKPILSLGFLNFQIGTIIPNVQGPQPSPGTRQVLVEQFPPAT